MTFSFTKNWGGSDVVTADDLNGNFTNVADIINGGIKNQHISTAANIGADKIADRYTLVKSIFNLVPYSAHATSTDMFSNAAGALSSTEFHVPLTANPATVARHEVIAQAGMEGHLMGITVYVTSSTVASGEYPEVRVKLNDTTIGAHITLKDNDTFYRLHANTPFSNPLLALSDGDVIDFTLQAETAATKCRGVWATIYERWSIGS